MLDRTFLFLPGIGATRELRLWRRGVDSWAAYRQLRRVRGIPPRLKERHDELLAVAESLLGRDPRFFGRLLPSGEGWRAYRAFGEGAAYVDIETTGDRTNAVTVVGVRKRGESRAFVRCDEEEAHAVEACGGTPYTPEAVSDFLTDATFLVTFNGATFDLPVLAADGVAIPPVPHADLRFVLARIGYAGGLKKIEDALGMGRKDHLAGLTGWDAVKLWRRWEKRRDAEALRTLVAYNVADFENLEPLARFACPRLVDETLRQASEQARLDAGAPEASPAGP